MSKWTTLVPCHADLTTSNKPTFSPCQKGLARGFPKKKIQCTPYGVNLAGLAYLVPSEAYRSQV